VAPSHSLAFREGAAKRLQGALTGGRSTPVVSLLRVEVCDDGEHASVIVWGLWEAQRAEDVLDVLLDGVFGDEQPLGDGVV
jgi:hypothetical protein